MNQSYFVGFNLSGWDYGQFFTYYSEFQRESTVLPYVEAAMLSLIFLVAFTSNLLVLVVLCVTKEKPVPSNYFIGCLAMAGMISVVSAPLVAVTRVTEAWIFGGVACSMMAASQYCASIITVWTMAFISMDRHQGTFKRLPFNTKPVVTMLTAIWIVAILASLPYGASFITTIIDINNKTEHVCTLVWAYNEHVYLSMLVLPPSMLLMFILPLAIMLVCYIRVIKKMKQSIDKFKNTKASVCVLFTEHKEMRVIRLLLLLVVCFCLLWMPISISFIMIFYDGITESMITTSQLFISTVCVAMTSACVSPVIYVYVNNRLRKGFLIIVRGKNNKVNNAHVSMVKI